MTFFFFSTMRFAEGSVWGNAPWPPMAETVLACLLRQVQTRQKNPGQIIGLSSCKAPWEASGFMTPQGLATSQGGTPPCVCVWGGESRCLTRTCQRTYTFFKLLLFSRKNETWKSMETLPCTLALWGLLWPTWGRSAWLTDQKAKRWPPSIRLNHGRNLEIGHLFSTFRTSFLLTP